MWAFHTTGQYGGNIRTELKALKSRKNNNLFHIINQVLSAPLLIGHSNPCMEGHLNSTYSSLQQTSTFNFQYYFFLQPSDLPGVPLPRQDRRFRHEVGSKPEELEPSCSSYLKVYILQEQTRGTGTFLLILSQGIYTPGVNQRNQNLPAHHISRYILSRSKPQELEPSCSSFLKVYIHQE